MRRAAALAVALLFVACGDDDDTPAPDAGPADAALPDAAAPPADASVDALVMTPPASPALPVMTPCPTGWRQVNEGDVTTCAPFPTAGGPATCSAGETHFPGEATCTQIGAACGPGDWATDLPAGANILYVKRGAAPGGDGTQAAPYALLSGAMAAATPGTIIAIDKQSYAGGYQPPPGLTLWGACVNGTTLTGAASSSLAVIAQRSGTMTLRNLTVSADRIGIIVDPGATVTLRGVIVSDSHHGAAAAARTFADALILR